MIKTPQTDPDHHTIGKNFLAWDGHIYFCDSFDSTIGYWMTLVYFKPDSEPPADLRRNVSVQAIDRTYHTIHTDNHGSYNRFGQVKYDQFIPVVSELSAAILK